MTFLLSVCYKFHQKTEHVAAYYGGTTVRITTTFVVLAPFDQDIIDPYGAPNTIMNKLRGGNIQPETIVSALHPDCITTTSSMWDAFSMYMDYSQGGEVPNLGHPNDAWTEIVQLLDGMTKFIIMPPPVIDRILSIVQGLAEDANWPIHPGFMAVFTLGSTGKKKGEIQIINPFVDDDHGITVV
ncbi:MAG: hypothetical protein COU32_04460 [Candidatus Magasanikbacteria bacterium CG10_big_fil_rev_8_21_14_0_10_42_10]|uniref:Uncharacterized protein n=2 Tax=Candidatus Magasanikiibacteriota TaxID=1752731 RepID=A0A2H0TV18_9BACT|nr:MAG: hypothetical protein COU32_04460 [Candidatus Magasanikbacteria bacterium CG10_big_fil_rev_8_21_14_0_10_42_10]PIZ93501.1 MAG: hypothetical protein COX82_02425 [Candidatus Magasanikbacteria bacterium CG_4_10_14_0_2_um_filter_41_10]